MKLEQGAERNEDWKWRTGLLVFIGAFYLWMLPTRHLFRVDSIYYLAGTESICEGSGYRLLTHQGEPRIGLYPPLQSLYLSGFWALNKNFPENVSFLNFGMMLVVAGIGLGMFCILRRTGCSALASAMVSFSLAVSPTVFDLAANFFSDLLFTLLATGALLLAQRGLDRRVSLHLAMGTLIGLMYLTRTAGLGVMVGTGMVMIWRAARSRTWVYLWTLVPMALAWVGWKLFPNDSPSYVNVVNGFIDTKTGYLAGGLPGYIQTILAQLPGYLGGKHFLECLAPRNEAFFGTMMTASFAHAISVLCALGFMAMTAHGFTKLRLEGKNAIAIVILVYMGQVLLWPFLLGPRALLPIFPFMAVCVFVSARELARWRAVRLCLAIFLTATLTVNLTASKIEADTMSDPKQWREVETTSQWIKQNLPADTTIAASVELPLFHFYHLSGRRFYLQPVRGTARENTAANADYLLAWGRNYKDSVKFEGGEMELLFESGADGYQVLRVKRK